MTDEETTGRRLRFFAAKQALEMHATGMALPAVLDQVALDAMPEYRAAGGFETRLLFGTPEEADGGGLSLVWASAGANYPLPRHSHDADCLYYIVRGEVRLGSRTVAAGDGFFVPAEAPYGYTAGPEGVELLEFRSVSRFASQGRETPAGWERILQGVRASRHLWTHPQPQPQVS